MNYLFGVLIADETEGPQKDIDLGSLFICHFSLSLSLSFSQEVDVWRMFV